MKTIQFSGTVLCVAMLALTGCGGGSTNSSPSSSGSTVISGLASKGPINKGTVKVFAVRDGVQDTTAIGQGQTDAAGHYSIDVGSYKGPVVVEVTGSFTDEVDPTATVTLQNPLRAVFSNASSGGNTVAVTPMTELACKKAKRGGAKLTKATIDDANTTIASKFSLTDIVSTLPVAGGSKSGEKEYAAACGTISQLANNSKKQSGKKLDDALTDVMSKMENEIEVHGDLSDDSVNELNAAGVEFSHSDRNKSGTEAPHVETEAETHNSGGGGSTHQ